MLWESYRMTVTTNSSISETKPTLRTGEMSAEEFELLMDRLDALSIRRGYSEKSRAAARLVMVSGATDKEAATQTGLSWQSVNQLMKRIRRRMESLPSGWVQVKGWFPAHVAKQLEALSELMQAAQKSGEPLEISRYSVDLSDD